MTLAGMIAATLVWLVSLVFACGVWFATLMMMDAGGQDHIVDMLVLTMILVASLYFFVTVAAIIIAWIAYLVSNLDFVRYAMLAPAVNIAVYIFVYFLLAFREPNWRFW